MRSASLLLCSFLLSGCVASRPVAPSSSAAAADPTEAALARITVVHGGAGPWVVAGYRMGQSALQRLGLKAGSFDLEVAHHAPAKVQYTCIADGAAAATGASLGKLNLALVDEPDPSRVATTYRRRSTGDAVTLRPTAGFVERYRDLPRERLAEAGREVLALPDAEVFEEVR
jgi:formylmethanofuran dehydrogenase subunit E